MVHNHVQIFLSQTRSLLAVLLLALLFLATIAVTLTLKLNSEETLIIQSWEVVQTSSLINLVMVIQIAMKVVSSQLTK